jgi:hypothetical protein
MHYWTEHWDGGRLAAAAVPVARRVRGGGARYRSGEALTYEGRVPIVTSVVFVVPFRT